MIWGIIQNNIPVLAAEIKKLKAPNTRQAKS
jgi:hypothetical protein